MIITIFQLIIVRHYFSISVRFFCLKSITITRFHHFQMRLWPFWCRYCSSSRDFLGFNFTRRIIWEGDLNNTPCKIHIKYTQAKCDCTYTYSDTIIIVSWPLNEHATAMITLLHKVIVKPHNE